MTKRVKIDLPHLRRIHQADHLEELSEFLHTQLHFLDTEIIIASCAVMRQQHKTVHVTHLGIDLHCHLAVRPARDPVDLIDLLQCCVYTLFEPVQPLSVLTRAGT